MTTPVTTPSQDDEHLRLLSIFHYVVAGLAALFALFPVFHLLLGFGMIAAGTLSGDPKALPAAFAGAFFVVFSLIWMTLGLGFAGCLAAGRFLAERRRYTFCLVVAGISCAFSPFGTVLGIFTLLVLLRDSVRVAFGRPPAGPAVPPGPAAPGAPAV